MRIWKTISKTRIYPKIEKKCLLHRAWQASRKAQKKFDGKVIEYFSESLKIAWAGYKLEIQQEIAEIVAEEKAEQIADEKELADLEMKMDAKKLNENAPRRVLVTDGKYEIGSKLLGFIITGFGVSFRPNVDMFSQGITPDTDYVQYAYFN